LSISVESLPPEQRLKYYRAMAADALQQAQEAVTDEGRSAFLTTAAKWSALAAEVARQMESADTPAIDAVPPSPR
jgi:hypothetical protein